MKNPLSTLALASLLSASLLSPAFASGEGNSQVPNFNQAKRLINQIHKKNPYTLYCNCKYEGKHIDLRGCGYKPQKDARRAARLEWEHVVPAEAFGQSFKEWREGDPELCLKRGKKYKGRKCAEKNPEFARMEADLYNLWPEVGELNGLRSNYSMAELGAERDPAGEFGQCRAKVEDRKFEPMPFAKGRVARTYLYMERAYPGRGIVSDKNRKLFEAWDKLHPADAWECERGRLIASVQGNKNPILEERCAAAKLQEAASR